MQTRVLFILSKYIFRLRQFFRACSYAYLFHINLWVSPSQMNSRMDDAGILSSKIYGVVYVYIDPHNNYAQIQLVWGLNLVWSWYLCTNFDPDNNFTHTHWLNAHLLKYNRGEYVLSNLIMSLNHSNSSATLQQDPAILPIYCPVHTCSQTFASVNIGFTLTNFISQNIPSKEI